MTGNMIGRVFNNRYQITERIGIGGSPTWRGEAAPWWWAAIPATGTRRARADG